MLADESVRRSEDDARKGPLELAGAMPWRSTRRMPPGGRVGTAPNLGLTCNPVGGLVRIRCIERDAVVSVNPSPRHGPRCVATASTRMSLDKVINTMRETGADMTVKYNETARRFAVNVIEC
jgi:L-serine dehydratase